MFHMRVKCCTSVSLIFRLLFRLATERNHRRRICSKGAEAAAHLQPGAQLSALHRGAGGAPARHLHRPLDQEPQTEGA